MKKTEPCYVIDAAGNKVAVSVNTEALHDMVEAFKDLSTAQVTSLPESDFFSTEASQKKY